MIIVIFAGGEGSRLWPLSTSDYPKHLLSIIDKRSSVLLAYERAKLISKDVYIVTDSTHADEVKRQIPGLNADNYIIEPARRGTASCLVAALSILGKKHDPKEVVAFMPADHFIRDTASFIHAFKIAEKVSGQASRIVLIGSEPDYPATGFGYILRGDIYDEESYVFNIKAFKEKPSYSMAQSYLKNGNYLWNSSYLVGSLSAFIEVIKKSASDLYSDYIKLSKAENQTKFFKTYMTFKKNSIDYALIEKVDNLLVLPALFDWLDLGSYVDLQRALGSDSDGNYVKGREVELENVENSFIHNSDKKPLAVIGLDNIVVVNTKDGILVARKDLAQRIGEVSKRFKENNK